MSSSAAALLGLVQALTEFLPVSSTAHLFVSGELMGQHVDDERFRAFVTIIQMGATVAVITYFWCDLAKLVHGAVAGKLLERRIEASGNISIAISLMGWGLILAVAERRARHRRTIGDVASGDAVTAGAGQALARVPGTSRSGATIPAGIALGLTREAAARFSFLLSVPIALGAPAGPAPTAAVCAAP